MANKNDSRQEIYLDTIEGYVPYRGSVLIKPISKDGATTKSGIIVGFQPDTKYVEEEGSHIADLTMTEGDVVAMPIHHETEGYTIPCEIAVGDHVWFNYFASLHGTDIWVGRELYRLIRYDGLVASQRGGQITILNGYVLLEEVDVEVKDNGIWAPAQKDRTRGIVRYMGQKRVYEHPGLTDEIELEIGDMVLIRKGAPVVPMERQKYLATFDDGKLYRRIKRCDISAVISSFVIE